MGGEGVALKSHNERRRWPGCVELRPYIDLLINAGSPR